MGIATAMTTPIGTAKEVATGVTTITIETGIVTGIGIVIGFRTVTIVTFVTIVAIAIAIGFRTETGTMATMTGSGMIAETGVGKVMRILALMESGRLVVVRSVATVVWNVRALSNICRIAERGAAGGILSTRERCSCQT